MRTKAILLATATVATAFGLWTARAQAPGPFTAAQVEAGRQVYNDNCANCHMPDLAGATDAPPLAGSAFMGAWRARSTADLFNKISKSMPPGRGGSFDDATY